MRSDVSISRFSDNKSKNEWRRGRALPRASGGGYDMKEEEEEIRRRRQEEESAMWIRG